jgi:hypothetical protein
MVPGGTLIGSFAPGGDAGNPLTANSNAVLTESIRFGNNPPAN